MFNYKDLSSINKPALICESEIITYQQLASLSKEITRSVNRRSLVFFIASNDLESIAGYIGIANANSVIMILDINIKNNQLNKLIKLYNPNYIFLNKKSNLIIKNFSEKTSIKNYCLLLNKNNMRLKLNDELFILISTSGTTGTSKFVKQSYSNLISNTNSILDFLPIKETDITITTLPMSYVYGLSIINTHIAKRALIILNNNSLVEKNFWYNFEKFKVTSFGGVPYTYEILNRIGFEKFKLKSLRYTTQAGGKLDTKIWRKILDIYEKLNIKFISMYGSSEATARMSYLPYRYAKEKIGSIGIPIPGGFLHLVDKNNNNIPEDNIEGELVYEGENVFMGYSFSQKDLFKGKMNNNKLYTGDIAKKDKDNFFYITGRKDYYIKIFGNRINIQEFQKEINQMGIKCILKSEEKNKISIYIDKNKNKEKIKLFIKQNTQLNLNIFNFKLVNHLIRNKKNELILDIN